ELGQRAGLPYGLTVLAGRSLALRAGGVRTSASNDQLRGNPGTVALLLIADGRDQRPPLRHRYRHGGRDDQAAVADLHHAGYRVPRDDGAVEDEVPRHEGSPELGVTSMRHGE